VIGYLGKRLLLAIPILLGASTIIFFLMHAAPGDPTSLYLSNPNISPRVIEQMRANLGLDQPVHIQYVKWLSSFLRGDFGYSFSQHRPIADILKDTIPNTLLLSAVALVVIFAIGVVVGTIQAVRQYSWVDNLATVLSFFFYSMPSFWFGLMLILLFSYKLQWLPASQMTSVEHEFLSGAGRLSDRLQHLLIAPRPEYLATAEEQVLASQLDRVRLRGRRIVGPRCDRRSHAHRSSRCRSG